MKKLVSLVMVLMLAMSNAGFAMDMDDLFGGLTAMFSPDADEAYAPGEVAELKHVNIKLTNVLESGKNEFYSPQDGYEFLMIEFEIENTDDEDLAISSMLCFSAWCDGKMYTISLDALSTAMLAGKMQLDCVIEPGDSVSGVIGYEVPEDWEEVVVEYKSDLLIGDKASFVVNRSK